MPFMHMYKYMYMIVFLMEKLLMVRLHELVILLSYETNTQFTHLIHKKIHIKTHVQYCIKPSINA